MSSHKKLNFKSRKTFVIAIDGPAASGKSTAAYLLAKKMGFTYLDTGAMYRALTWKALRDNIDVEDEKALSKMAETTDINVSSRSDAPGAVVHVDGKEVSNLLRTSKVNKWVSVVSKPSGVREAMAKLQRNIAREKPVVAEGRDIGTVVFPEADVKVFLIASVQKRAERRWRELQEKGILSTKKQVKKELKLRDKIDSERELAPLKKASDAYLIDNTNLDIQQTLEKILSTVNSKIKPTSAND